MSEGRTHLRFEVDGSRVIWPDPTDPTEVQWRLRYGTPTRSDLLVAASTMHAYSHLVSLSQRERNRYLEALKRHLTDEKASNKP